MNEKLGSDILYLPGANPESKTLATELLSQSRVAVRSIEVQEYSFWQGGEADMAREVSLLPGRAFDLVIAKSVGAIVFLQAAYAGGLSWGHAILLGTPVCRVDEFGAEAGCIELLQSDRVSLVHQTNDKVCPIAAVKACRPKHLFEIDGADHLYTRYLEYSDYVSRRCELGGVMGGSVAGEG